MLLDVKPKLSPLDAASCTSNLELLILIGFRESSPDLLLVAAPKHTDKLLLEPTTIVSSTGLSTTLEIEGNEAT